MLTPTTYKQYRKESEGEQELLSLKHKIDQHNNSTGLDSFMMTRVDEDLRQRVKQAASYGRETASSFTRRALQKALSYHEEVEVPFVENTR